MLLSQHTKSQHPTLPRSDLNKNVGHADGTDTQSHLLADLQIVQSVSGNFNVFNEKFLRKERIY